MNIRSCLDEDRLQRPALAEETAAAVARLARRRERSLLVAGASVTAVVRLGEEQQAAPQTTLGSLR